MAKRGRPLIMPVLIILTLAVAVALRIYVCKREIGRAAPAQRTAGRPARRPTAVGVQIRRGKSSGDYGGILRQPGVGSNWK